jgi:SRSO17 transposase
LGWRTELAELQERLGALFGRTDSRRQANLYLEGLLSAVERKNGWQLAEQIGDARPWRTQRVLSRTLWAVDAARDLCREYVVKHLGAADGVLVIDETGFLKKGSKSAGVARQYSGTAGRIENCQIGVFLAYASGRGHALIDRELYLPQDWAEDDARRATAGIPTAVSFATKPQLAQRMIARAIAAGVPFAWVVGDEVYGSDRRLRLFLEKRERPFVLAVRRNEKLWSMLAGRLGQHTATDLAAAPPDAASRPGREPRASDCMTGRACASPGYKRRPGNIDC